MENKSLRNFIWIFVGIILMGVFVVAVTSISDTGIATTGNFNIDGNITFENSPLNFQSNGTSLLFINQSSGNVGIGTINPTNKLHVVTTGNPAKFESTSGNGRIEIDAPSTKNSGVQFFENNVLRWGIFNQGTDDSLKFQNKDFATRLVVQQSGNVGIGTTSPSSKLEVNGNVSLNNTLFVTESGNVGIGINNPTIDFAIGDADTGLEQVSDGVLTIITNNGERVRIDGTGKIGLPNLLESDSDDRQLCYKRSGGNLPGEVSFSGDASDCLSSSIRHKENVEDLEWGLNQLMQLRPVRFNYKESRKESIGFIAEEVYETDLLWFVNFNDDGQINSLKSKYFQVIAIKAIQELKIENDLLKDKLTQIEERLDSKELICQI